MGAVPARGEVIALSPLERPDVALVVASCRGGALGVLDLGRDRAIGERALAAASRMVDDLGVRVPDGWSHAELPPQVSTVIVPAAADVARFLPRRVLVQVTSLEEAHAAIAAG